jgi:hypothetical protein
MRPDKAFLAKGYKSILAGLRENRSLRWLLTGRTWHRHKWQAERNARSLPRYTLGPDIAPVSSDDGFDDC